MPTNQGPQRLHWWLGLSEVANVAVRRSWHGPRPPNGKLWAAARQASFRRDAFRCVECGAASRLEAHHIKPLFRGGAAYDLANLRTLCRSHHIERHRRPVDPGWKRLVDELL